jgi:putative intracellular protease/amidase
LPAPKAARCLWTNAVWAGCTWTKLRGSICSLRPSALRLANTLPIAEVDPSRFGVIYFTGGHGVMWDFPDNPDLRRVAETIYNQGGIVSAVCHGVAGLLDLKDSQGQLIIKGRNITGFSDREELLSGMKNQVPFFLEDRLVSQGAVPQRLAAVHFVCHYRWKTGDRPEPSIAQGRG